jgi:hypothetical protein
MIDRPNKPFETVDDVLFVLENLGDVPEPRKGERHRTIYEGGNSRGKPTGRFWIDYASFRHGSSAEVPLRLIQELERSGKIVRAYPDTNIPAWRLAMTDPLLSTPPAQAAKEKKHD